MKRWQQDLFSKLIALKEQVKADSFEYLRLIKVPDGAAALSDDPKILKLRSRIQNSRRQIIVLKRHLHDVPETGERFSFCSRLLN